jgi:hypothetical protein
LRRREFITLLSGAAIGLPLAARAQQPAMPVIGYLSSFPADINPKFAQAFRQGLNDAGFFEGRNATIEYRWDEEGRYDGQRWQPMFLSSAWPCSSRAPFLRRLRPRRRPPPFQSYSRSAATPSRPSWDSRR